MRNKILAVMEEVNHIVKEREAVVGCIALALLARKNLFILGDTGQAKSYAIDQFKKRITGVRMFDVLMSKQMDQDQLFGRLDLASIIPGNVAQSTLESDATYQGMRSRLELLLQHFNDNTDNIAYKKELADIQSNLECYRRALAELYGGTPTMVTAGKIPDSEIIFLDELFKASEGVINSLLKALNERQYTNEGITVDLPAISYFAASNEIPDFRNPEEQILRPLYDRFDLKVVTAYIQSSQNRAAALEDKQKSIETPVKATMTLEDLLLMQREAAQVVIPARVNIAAENILLALRAKGLHISDRKFLNYGSIVQAMAWLNGRQEAEIGDLAVLEHYFWMKPDEIETVREEITRQTTDPLKEKMEDIHARALSFQEIFNANPDTAGRALFQLRNNLVELYAEILDIRGGLPADSPAQVSIAGEINRLEDINRQAHDKSSFTYIPLDEINRLKNAS